MDWLLAFRTGGPQHLYRFTLDDQPLGPLGRFQRKKVQPSVEQLYEIERHLDVDVKELLVSSKELHIKNNKNIKVCS